MMKEEKQAMKYLKIDNNKGYFLRPKDSGAEWIEIDTINKDDLLYLLNNAISSDFEMDPYSEDKMANKAHQIIYKNIYEKFTNLDAMKSKFKDDSESFYKDAIEKYSVDSVEEKKA
jgi:hypothetical protein